MRDVKEIIKEIEIFNDADDITYEPLNGGFSNCTYKVKANNIYYVLRINSNQNSLFNLRREDELEVVKKANELGIAPRVFITENKSEYLITEYKEGSILNNKEIHTPGFIQKTAHILSNIHKIESINRDCSPFFMINKYLEGARENGVIYPEGLSEYLKKLEEIEKRFSAIARYTKKYCHNDYYIFNIINNNGDLSIIDWELSGYGDLFFDLATISFSNAFSEQEDELLLKSYFGFIEDEHKCLMHDMKYINMIREIAWGLYHSGIETKKVNHDLNYYESAIWFLDRLKEGYVTT